MPPTRTSPHPLVSVIIPCYNQGRFLSKAIESILVQSFQDVEIIVIDDGSTDITAAVAGKYTDVRYVYQANKGLSAARNAGIDQSKGDYLVFLDADDWLLIEALEINLQCFSNNPEAFFVSGAYTNLSKDGSAEVKKTVDKDHYCRLLEGNYISMHAAVMYRREAFKLLRYDSSLKSCEDYDIYLKIARNHPVFHHSKMIAVYYHHETNMSCNMPLMLECALTVLNRQIQCLKNEAEAVCLRRGIAYWKKHYSVNIYSKLIQTSSCTNIERKHEISSLYSHRKCLYLKYFIVKPLMPLRQYVVSKSPIASRILHRIGLYEGFSPGPK